MTQAIAVLAILLVGTGAFSLAVRKIIGARDNWQCQDDDCTKSFQTGWNVDASHFDHDGDNPDYDNPDNGEIQCLQHHAESHYNYDDPSLTDDQNDWAGDKISSREPRTRWWKRKNG